MTSLVSKRWCFIFNNYDEAELDAIRLCLSTTPEVRYAIFGKEVSDSGTPHLQGYISCTKAKRFTGIKKMVGDRSHVEVAKGNEAANIAYCSKSDPDPETFGDESESGRRTDLDAFKEAVKSGILNFKQLREDYIEVCAKYLCFVVEYICDQIVFLDLPKFPLLPWQQELHVCLKLQSSDREVIFVVDYVGNKGKMWYAKYYMEMYLDTTFLMRFGKHADMSFMFPPHLRVLFLDCTRK